MNVNEISTLNVVAEMLEQSVKNARNSGSGDMHVFMLVNDVSFALSMIDTMLKKYDADGNPKKQAGNAMTQPILDNSARSS